MEFYNKFELTFNKTNDMDCAIFEVIVNRLKQNITCYSSYVFDTTEHFFFTKQSKIIVNNAEKKIVIENVFVKKTFNVNEKFNLYRVQHNGGNGYVSSTKFRYSKNIFKLSDKTFLTAKITEEAGSEKYKSQIGEMVEVKVESINRFNSELTPKILTKVWNISFKEYKRSKKKEHIFVNETTTPFEIYCYYDVKNNIKSEIDLSSFTGGNTEEDLKTIVEVIEIK